MLNDCIYSFLEYVKREFPGTLDTHWNWDFAHNMIEYICYREEDVIDALVTFIPEITKDEVMRFFGKYYFD